MAQDPRAPLERRIAGMLRQAGTAVTMTTLTDIAAFAIGTLSPLPAIQSFCTYAAICIAIDYVLQARARFDLSFFASSQSFPHTLAR